MDNLYQKLSGLLPVSFKKAANNYFLNESAVDTDFQMGYFRNEKRKITQQLS